MQHSPHPHRVVLSEQPGEWLRRARNGQLYSQKEVHAYYGCDVGESCWQKAQDETTQSNGLAHFQTNAFPRRRTAEQPVAPFGVKRIRIRSPPRPCNPDQPAASLYQAAQLALRDMHTAVHSEHRDYRMFLEQMLRDIYDIWRPVNEPKNLRATWSTQWSSLTCMLEDIARDAAAHNCRYEVACSVNGVAGSATIQT